MKNIVFVFNPECYPVPAINGGAVEALVTNLINENEIQQKFNFHVIMCKHSTDNTKYDYSNYKHTKFYDFYQTDFKFKTNKLVNAINKRLNYALPLYSAYENFILSKVNEINPDFVIYEGVFNSTVRKLKNSLGKEKLVLHVHHQILPKFKLDKHFGRMLCVSEFVKRDWQQSQKLNEDFKYQILNNVLTSTTFKNKLTETEKKDLQQKLNIKENDFVVVYCGRLIKEKGIDVLIKAIKTLNKDNLKLMIIGASAFKNSKMTPFVEELKEIVGENKNVFFTGFVPNEELYKYYSLANLQVIPSVWEEVAGIVALEGRAVGLPQVITNSGGLPEYASKNAIILEKGENLQENLQKEILKFYNGEYANL
ncbi:MAG: glycosyltransferase family 4 protein, partial [Clostridia bacterium]|nr:glycosyltransferase family 4 protein [Clostridia bacterium]